MMSIPRDLKVDDPRPRLHGQDQRRLRDRRPEPDASRRSRALFAPGPFKINHVINVNFGGFRRAVDYVGCVYVDVDRRYFNDNSARPGSYATIDIQPGYQKLCGQDALDYVRYRHGDNDLVRAARQQDFLRQSQAARSCASGSISERATSSRGSSAATRRPTSAVHDARRCIACFKLVAFSAASRSSRCRSRRPARPADDGYLTVDARTRCARRSTQLHERQGEAPAPRRRRARRPTAKPAAQAQAASARQPPSPAASSRRPPPSEAWRCAIKRSRQLGFPFYFPSCASAPRATTDQLEPRTYRIRDERGTSATTPTGSSLKTSPSWASTTACRARPGGTRRSSTTRTRRARSAAASCSLFYDGTSSRLVAWQTRRGVYWVTNTLTETIPNSQMVAIAASLTRRSWARVTALKHFSLPARMTRHANRSA